MNWGQERADELAALLDAVLPAGVGGGDLEDDEHQVYNRGAATSFEEARRQVRSYRIRKAADAAAGYMQQFCPQEGS